MADEQPRDVRGRFTKIDPERDVIAPGLGVPREYAYGQTRRYAPAGDDLAQGDPQDPLQPRTATRVADDEEARTRYGVQGALGREAARRSSDPMDPSAHLTGAV